MLKIIIFVLACLQLSNVNAKLPNDMTMYISKMELEKRVKSGNLFEISVIEDLSYNKLIINHPTLDGQIYFKRKHFYYSFDDDVIFSSPHEKSENCFAMSWAESLNELYSVKDKEFLNLNSKIKMSFALPRMNYVTNKPLLSNLDSTTLSKYQTKLRQLLSISSEIEAYDKENIDLILRKINQKEEKDDVFWSKIEIPLTIYFGEFFIREYQAKWDVKTYFDDYGLEICIPFLIYQKGEVDLFKFFYNELVSSKVKDSDYQVDASYLFGRINKFFLIPVRTK